MLWQFLLAAILIELTPGPNMTWLAAMGAAKGRLTALAAVAGISLGLAIAAVVAGFGLTTALSKWPILFDGLRWIGAVYLLYLAFDAWRDANVVTQSEPTNLANAFGQGLITNILNPKAYLFYAAILPRFIDSQQAAQTQIITLSIVYVAVATIIHAIIVVLAGSVAEWLQTSSQAKLIRKLMAVAIAIAAVWFFISTGTLQ